MSDKNVELAQLGSFVGTLLEIAPTTQWAEEIAKHNDFKDPDEFWNWVGERNEKLIQKDPQKAFELAVQYINYKGDNETDPNVKGWMKSSGLALLTNAGLKEILISRVNSPEGAELLSNILDAATRDISQFSDDELWNNHPEFYNKMASVAILLGLKGAPEGTHAKTASLIGEAIKRDGVFMHQAIVVGRASKDVKPMIEQSIYPEVFNPEKNLKFNIATVPEKNTIIIIRHDKTVKSFMVPFFPYELAILEYARLAVTDHDAETASTALRELIGEYRLPDGGLLLDRQAAFGEIRETCAFIDAQLARGLVHTSGVVEKLSLMRKILEPFLPDK